MRKLPGRRIRGDGKKRSTVEKTLPFALTGAQQMALAEIDADMGSDRRMLRLLQGDVGSGKTVVALMSMLNAVEAGFQAAMMAPTEILARQHYASLEPLWESAGVRLALLTGREKGERRAVILQDLANGNIDILVGTHALFQEDVAFKALAFAVVDEQHRFGVHQRLMLQGKGGVGIDVLVMTIRALCRLNVSVRWWKACAAPLMAVHKSIGSVRWSRNPTRSMRLPRRNATRICKRSMAMPWVSCMDG
jgi:ATP-dependent DNA helicase RecG